VNQNGSTCKLFGDSKFAFGNVEKTMTLDEFKFSNDLSQCSLYGKNLTELDSLQKVWLLTPFVTTFKSRALESVLRTDIPENSTWYFRAQFVARQNKIGDLQPLILRVDRDGYLALWLLILNEQCIPVSCYQLDGCRRDLFVKDSTGTFCTKRNKIVGNRIDSYETRETWAANGKPPIVDSIVYRTQIGAKGQIVTTRIDSVRYFKSN